MVLIEAPASTTPRPAPAKASNTAAPAADRGRTPSLDDADVDAILAAPDPQLADTVPDPASESVNAPRRRTPEPVPQAAEGPPPTRTDWVSAETQLLKRWLMIGAVAIAAVIFLIVLGGLWLSRKNDGGVARAESNNKADSATNAQASATDNETSNADTIESDPVVEPDSNDADSAEPVSAEIDEAATTESDASAAVDNGAHVPPADATSGSSSGPDATVAAAGDTASDSNSAGASDANATDDGSSDGAPDTPAISARDALREFESFLEDTTFEPSLVPVASAYDLIPSPSRTFDLSAALQRPTRGDVNVEAQLKMRLTVEFTDFPLARFLQFVSDFTNVPVTLDPIALRSVGLEADSPVDVTAENQDLATILRSGLEPLKLDYSVVGKHLVVVARGASAEGFDERKYQVFDIVGEDPSEAQAMVDVITSLVAPASWRERGGTATISLVKGLLTVTNTPEVHYEIVLLCERVRIARALRPQGDLPDHIHDLTPRVSLALPKLAQPITASYTAPTRLTEILQYLGETSEMEMIVDWRALDEIGHTPESLAQLEVNEQSLSETLQTLLGPMELSFIVLDDHTLQITSAKVAFSKPDIELFRINQVAAKDGGQKVIDGVRSILGEAFAGQRGPSGLRFDGFSNSLIIAAPQYQIAAIGRLIEQLTVQSAVPAERPELPLEAPVEEQPAVP